MSGALVERKSRPSISFSADFRSKQSQRTIERQRIREPSL